MRRRESSGADDRAPHARSSSGRRILGGNVQSGARPLLARRLGDRPAVGAVLGDLLIAERAHELLATHGCLDGWGEPLALRALAFVFVLLELRHHAAGEELERLADVIVAI